MSVEICDEWGWYIDTEKYNNHLKKITFNKHKHLNYYFNREDDYDHYEYYKAIHPDEKSITRNKKYEIKYKIYKYNLVKLTYIVSLSTLTSYIILYVILYMNG
jgi:hypothetical protein